MECTLAIAKVCLNLISHQKWLNIFLGVFSSLVGSCEHGSNEILQFLICFDLTFSDNILVQMIHNLFFVLLASD